MPSHVTTDRRSPDAWHTVWAKTGCDEVGNVTHWLPLHEHLTDTAAVAGLLVDHWVSPQVMRRIARDFGGDAGDVRRLVVWLGAVHDVGKASLPRWPRISRVRRSVISWSGRSRLSTGSFLSSRFLGGSPHAMGRDCRESSWCSAEPRRLGAGRRAPRTFRQGGVDSGPKRHPDLGSRHGGRYRSTAPLRLRSSEPAEPGTAHRHRDHGRLDRVQRRVLPARSVAHRRATAASPGSRSNGPARPLGWAGLGWPGRACSRSGSTPS
jgi:hypothetical protein